MKQRPRMYYSNAQKELMWDRWQQVREGWTNSDNLEFQRVVDDAIAAMNEAEDSNQYEDMQRKMSTQLGTTITK